MQFTPADGFKQEVPFLKGRPVSRSVKLMAYLAPALVVASAILILGVQREHRSTNVNTPGEIEATIMDLQQLTTIEFVYREVVYHQVEQRVLGIRTGNQSVLFSIDVRVRAGVDFSAGMEATVAQDEMLLVTLPPARILDVDADESTINQYFAEERFGRLDMVEIGTQINATKERLKEDALERGLLDRAERQAEQTIRGLLTSSGWETVRIRFRPERELQG